MRPTIAVLSVLLLAACGQEPHDASSFDPDAHFAARGPADADTVVIFAQGGPFTELRPQLVEQLPGMAGRLRVSVHQPWTLDPDLLAFPDSVSQDNAAALNRVARDMLDRTVRHFADQGRAVCVVGHSYGALLTLDWLSGDPVDVPVQVLAGRLALPDQIWTNFRDGRLWWFPDGRTPEALSGPTPDERLVPMRLQADLGALRFMDLLEGRDLRRVTFVYGDRDRLVGTLTEAEVNFLETAGARVVRLPDADHRSMFDSTHAAALEGVFACRAGGH